MKKIVIVSATLFLTFCSSKKNMSKNNETILPEYNIETLCPTDGKCTVELFRNKSLEIKKDEFGSMYHQIIDSEIKILIDRPGYSTVERLFDFTKYVICDDIITFVTFNTSTHGVDIHMMDDEWFFVSILEFSTMDSKSIQTFYLCDQWEGFVKLIKDKNIV